MHAHGRAPILANCGNVHTDEGPIFPKETRPISTMCWSGRKDLKPPSAARPSVSAALKGRWDDVPRRSLEAIAVEGYRTGALTETQVRRLLQLETRFQVHALLKEHLVPLRYTEVDLEEDLRAQRELGVLPGR